MTAIRTILLAEDSPADAEMAVDALRDARLANPIAVSYTHLTLPTICSV